MRSILFFLLVSGTLLLALWLVVEKDTGFRPPEVEPLADETFAEEVDTPPEGNEIDLPVYDQRKGREYYHLSGYLTNDIASLKLDELDHLVLRRGRLRIPIYDDPGSTFSNILRLPGDGAGEENAGDATTGGAKPEPGSSNDTKGPRDSSTKETSPGDDTGDLSVPEPVWFIFEFDRAEYRAARNATGTGEGVIQLSEGGRGYSEDGTEIDFEELTIHIEKRYVTETGAEKGETEAAPGGEDAPPEVDYRHVFRLTTTQPVSIRHSLLEIFSPNGLESRLKQKDELERIHFHPPVTTFLDASAASFFGLKMPGTDGADPTRPPARIVAACDGPLVLDRTGDPKTVTFHKNVFIYPVETAYSGTRPERGDVWFHCQELALELAETERSQDTGGDPTSKRPRRGPPITRAVASWPGGRVQAFHEGFRFSGDELIWRRVDDGAGSSATSPTDGSKLRSEAILTGIPTFEEPDRGLAFQADEAALRLDERRIFLRENVIGSFDVPVDELSEKDEKKGARPSDEPGDPGSPGEDSGKRIGLPQRMDFEADEVEVVFASSADGDRPQASRSEATQDAASNEKAAQEGKAKERPSLKKSLRGVSQFLARSRRDDGLLLRSATDESFSLRGRDLVYDAETEHAVLTGGAELPPRFQHETSSGTAETISFILEDEEAPRLEFSDRVTLDVNVEALRENAKADGEARDTQASAGAEPNGPAPERRVFAEADEVAQVTVPEPETVRIVSEHVDVRFAFDENERIGVHSVHARTQGKRPVTLTPLSGEKEAGYRVEGPNLRWVQASQTAIMTAQEVSSAGRIETPRLAFKGGSLGANRIQFDRESWTAHLAGGVVIRSRLDANGEPEPDTAVGPAPQESQREMVVTASRTTVVFNEDFQPLSRGLNEDDQLRRVKTIHAWGRDDLPIVITRPGYRAEADEATWVAERQELRLFGEGQQKFHRGADDTLVASEITYLRDRGLIQLRRDVRGQIRLAHRSSLDPGKALLSSDDPGGKARGPEREPLLWEFNGPALDVAVAEDPETDRLELRRLDVHEKVFLECQAEGIQLYGDDLTYDHAQKEIRVFSRHGRYQTLIHSQTVRDENGKEKVLTNKIDSREIRVWYLADPGTPGTTTPRQDHVVVKFEKDVTAAFHAPKAVAALVPTSSGSASGSDEHEQWKLRANQLLLRILLQDGQTPSLPYAYAEGDVDFTSEKKQAMAREAIYEQAGNRLILRGHAEQPVRLYYDGETSEAAEIELRQRGNRFELIRRRRS